MSYSATVLADSPALYWRLGEASGTTVADATGNGWTGTYTGSPTLGVAGLLSGDSNTAITLASGTAIGVSLAYNATFNDGPVSAEVWFNTSTAPSSFGYMLGRAVDSGDKDWSLGMESNGKLFGTTNAEGTLVASPLTYNDGKTHHAVLTIDGTTMRLYADGVQVASIAGSRGHFGSPGIYVGYRGAGTSQFIGTVDEAAVYPTALTPTQIAAHYAAGTTAGTTSSGSASLIASVGTSAIGLVGTTGAGSLTATIGATASGVVATSGNASLNVATDTSVAGLVGVACDATLAVTGSTSAVGALLRGATLIVGSTTSANGQVGTSQNASLGTSVGTTTSGSTAVQVGAQSTTVSVTVAASGSVSTVAANTRAVTATTSASGRTSGHASIATTCGTSASGSVHVSKGAALAISVAATSAGTDQRLGAAARSTSVAISATGETGWPRAGWGITL